jgi:hypothetical protein
MWHARTHARAHTHTHTPSHQAIEATKREIAAEVGVPLFPPLGPQPLPAGGRGGGEGEAPVAALRAVHAVPVAGGRRVTAAAVRRAAVALGQSSAAQIPAQRRREMEEMVRGWAAEVGTGGAAREGDAAQQAQQAGRGEREQQASPGAAGAGVDGPCGGGGADGSDGSKAWAAWDASLLSPPLTPLELHEGLLAGVGARRRRRTIRSWLAGGRAGVPGELLLEVGAVAGGAENVSEGDSAAGGAPGPRRGGQEEGRDEDEDEDEEEGGRGEAVRMGTAGELEGGGGAGGLCSPTTASEPPAAGRGSSSRQSIVVGHEWHGQEVVRALAERGGDDALVGLCMRFRRSFVRALRPQHLPEGWSVTHQAVREFGEHSVYRRGVGGEGGA